MGTLIQIVSSAALPEGAVPFHSSIWQKKQIISRHLMPTPPMRSKGCGNMVNRRLLAALRLWVWRASRHNIKCLTRLLPRARRHITRMASLTIRAREAQLAGTPPNNPSQSAHRRVQRCCLHISSSSRSCTALPPQIGMLLVRAHLPRRAPFPVQVQAREAPRSARLLAEGVHMVWAWQLSTKPRKVVVQCWAPREGAAPGLLCTRMREELQRQRQRRRKRSRLPTIQYSTKRWW